VISVDEYEKLTRIIDRGFQSEKTVIAYTETLITAWNTRTDFVNNTVPQPHPCSLNPR
jgi:hypothetical protein